MTTRFIGLILLALGLYMLGPAIPPLACHFSAGMVTPFLAVWMLVQLAEIIAGTGLLFLKSWARWLALPAIATDLVIRTGLLVRVWSHSRSTAISAIPANEVVVTFAIWPALLVLVLLVFCLFMLLVSGRKLSCPSTRQRA
jgi:hypothetical protein